jgi:hypothetical protein
MTIAGDLHAYLSRDVSPERADEIVRHFFYFLSGGNTLSFLMGELTQEELDGYIEAVSALERKCL